MTGVDRGGLLVVDKPEGMTSHDVVGRVRRLAGTRRVGHAGTLDPMATGVLVVGIGPATRLLGHLALQDKAYDATIRLGVTTTTHDAEGDVVATADPAAVSAVTDEALRAATAELTGPLQQVPPEISAIKVDGVRAYARARAGEVVELAARPVTVSRFDLVGRSGDRLDVQVECSTGTYIRSLARDVGALLGVGGHLAALRRTRVGRFSLAAATPLADVVPDRDLIPIAPAAADALPSIRVDGDEAGRIRHGQRRVVGPPDLTVGAAAILDDGGELVAVAEIRKGVAHPHAVFG